MPFAKCRHCGRLFHTFEPLVPDSPEAYWPALGRGDAVYEVCPECLQGRGEAPAPTEDAAESDGASQGDG